MKQVRLQILFGDPTLGTPKGLDMEVDKQEFVNDPKQAIIKAIAENISEVLQIKKTDTLSRVSLTITF